MRPVSQAFLDTIRGSHKIAVRATVLETFQTGTNPQGTEIPDIDGNVESEAKIIGEREVQGALIFSSLDMITNGSRMWPNKGSDLLAPFGNEIFIERGVVLANDVVEWVGLGYFRIDSIEQNTAPDGPIEISGSDRMVGIEEARFTQPRQFLQGRSLGSIVEELVTDVYPDAVIEWDDNTNESTLGRDLIFERERIDALTDLVTSVGKQVFWDHRGILVISDVPDPTTPVYTVNSGADGVLVEMARDLSRIDAYNGVVAVGEAADEQPPVHALVVDEGINSPTRWGGKYGKVPRFYFSPFITTQAQANSAATAILQQSIGLPYNVDFQASPNVALEPLDPVLVEYPRTSRSIATRDELHILQRIRYPLNAHNVLSAVTKEQKLVTVGLSG